MKKRFVLGKILLLAVFLLPAVLAAAVKKIPADKWTIATAGDKNEVALLAATELQELLAVRIGKKIPIVTDKKVPAKPVILLGKVNPKLGREAFAISRKGNTITITGGCRIGTLYGVYEFVEKYCDVWSVAPGVTYAPKNKALSFGEVKASGKPAIARRELYHIGQDWTVTPMRRKWSNFDRRNRISVSQYNKMFSPYISNEFRVSHTLGQGCHTFYAFVPPEKYAKTHPEYFSLNASGVRDFRKNAGGQLCLSNKDVENIVFDALVGAIKKDRKKSPKYYPRVYDFSHLDNTNYLCFCKECKKIIDKYGKEDSGLMVWFINKIARRVKPLYPDVKLRTFAYVSTEPLPKGIRAEDNVIMQLCDLYSQSNHMYPLTNKINKKREALTRGWGKLTKHLMIWDYILQGGGVPVVPVDAIAADVKLYQECNVKWIFMESEIRAGNPASFEYLKNFLVAQFYYNPNKDLNKLLDVYCKGVFGKVHKEMRAYLEKLRKAQNTIPTADMGAWHRRELKHLTLPFLRECKALVEKAWKLNKDPEVAIHILREKNVLDNALNSKLSAYPQFAAERKAIQKNLLKNRLTILRAHGFVESQYKKVEKEVRLPIEESMMVFTDIPEELKKYPPGTLKFLGSSRVTSGGFNGKRIKDPDSKMNTVIMWTHADPRKYTKRIGVGVYDQQWKRATGTGIDATTDEKYHWRKIVRFKMGPSTIFYALNWHAGMNLRGFFVVSDGVKADEDPNLYELWVSIKFQGPAYKKGSTKPNGIFFERGILVPISKKLGNFDTKAPKSSNRQY